MAPPILSSFFFFTEAAAEDPEGPAPSLLSPGGNTGAGSTGAGETDLVGGRAQGTCLLGLGPGVEFAEEGRVGSGSCVAAVVPTLRGGAKLGRGWILAPTVPTLRGLGSGVELSNGPDKLAPSPDICCEVSRVSTGGAARTNSIRTPEFSGSTDLKLQKLFNGGWSE